jgi:hypothetical protein
MLAIMIDQGALGFLVIGVFDPTESQLCYCDEGTGAATGMIRCEK